MGNPKSPASILRRLLSGLLASAALLASVAATAEPPELVVPPFDLIEEHPDPGLAEDHRRRLAAVRRQFVEGVREHGLYRVVESAAADDAIAQLRARHEYLYNCPDCKAQLGAAARVPGVAVGWVQKVSNLILNINVEVSDAASGRVLLVKSVDIRGNNDESWMRGMRFLLRDLVERRQAAAGSAAPDGSTPRGPQGRARDADSGGVNSRP